MLKNINESQVMMRSTTARKKYEEGDQPEYLAEWKEVVKVVQLVRMKVVQ